MRKFVTLFATAALAATPCFAGETKDPVKFRFDRTLLSSPHGTAKIYKSMRARATQKCDPRGEKIRSAVEACADDLVSQWVAAVDDERLSALHAAS